MLYREIESKIKDHDASLEQKATKADLIIEKTRVDNIEIGKASKLEVEVERQRINQLSNLQQGSTTGDAELIDARVSANGITYKTVGENVRALSKAEAIKDYTITPVKTNFFNLPFNYWTNGNIVVEGSGTWKNKVFEIKNIPIGDYILYIDTAEGYENGLVTYAELSTYNISDNSKVMGRSISVGDKYTNITVSDGQYIKVTFFLSQATSVTNGRSKFTGIYLFKGKINDLLDVKILNDKLDSSFVKNYISPNADVLMSEVDISLTSTNPSAYKYIPYSYNVQPLSRYWFEITSYTGNLSETLAVIVLKNSNGNTLSQKVITTSSKNIYVDTTSDTSVIQVNFYLTYESSKTGTFTVNYENVNLYKTGDLNKTVIVNENNLSDDLKGKINNAKNDDLFVLLPKEICVAVGTTLEIYNSQVIHCGNIDNYHFHWKCNIGIPYARKYTITGEGKSVGNHTLYLDIFDNNLNEVFSGSTTVKIINANTNTTKKIGLAIGDSLTDIDKWRKELKKLADTNYGKDMIGYIGTKGSEANFKHEGMSGWQSSHFVKDSNYTYGGSIILNVSGVNVIPQSKKIYTIQDNQGINGWEFEKAELIDGVGKLYFNRITNGSYTINSNGTITAKEGSTSGDIQIAYSSWEWQSGNPFWNPTTSEIDFNYYLTKNNFAKPDFITIFLGTNDLQDVFGNYETLKSAYNSTVQNIKLLVDKILSQLSDTKIFISLIPYQSNDDGIGRTNPSSASRFNVSQHLKVFTMNELIYDAFNSYNPNVSIVPIEQTMDSDNVYGSVLLPINPRMTKTVSVPVESVHPREEGFYQMADAFIGVYQKAFN